MAKKRREEEDEHEGDDTGGPQQARFVKARQKRQKLIEQSKHRQLQPRPPLPEIGDRGAVRAPRWNEPVQIDFYPDEKPGKHYLVYYVDGGRRVFHDKPVFNDAGYGDGPGHGLDQAPFCAAGPYRVHAVYHAPYNPAGNSIPRIQQVLLPDGRPATLEMNFLCCDEVLVRLDPSLTPAKRWWDNFLPDIGGCNSGSFSWRMRDSAVPVVHRAARLLDEWRVAERDMQEIKDAFHQAEFDVLGETRCAWYLAHASVLENPAYIEPIMTDPIVQPPRRIGWRVGIGRLAQVAAIFFRRKEMFDAAAYLPFGKYVAWPHEYAPRKDPRVYPDTYFSHAPDPWIDITVE